MLLTPTADILKHRARLEICPGCVFRPAGDANGFPRPCEETCPIFHHLDELRVAAQLIDPMFSRERAVAAAIRRITTDHVRECVETATPLKQYAAPVARLVAHACD